MTAHPIWHNPKPTLRNFRGLLPMPQEDERFWTLRRERKEQTR